MNKKLLITTALVGFAFTSNASASILNIFESKSAETTYANGLNIDGSQSTARQDGITSHYESTDPYASAKTQWEDDEADFNTAETNHSSAQTNWNTAQETYEASNYYTAQTTWNAAKETWAQAQIDYEEDSEGYIAAEKAYNNASDTWTQAETGYAEDLTDYNQAKDLWDAAEGTWETAQDNYLASQETWQTAQETLTGTINTAMETSVVVDFNDDDFSVSENLDSDTATINVSNATLDVEKDINLKESTLNIEDGSKINAENITLTSSILNAVGTGNEISADVINVKDSKLNGLEALKKVTAGVFNFSGDNELTRESGNIALNAGELNIKDGTTAIKDENGNKGTLYLATQLNNSGTLDANLTGTGDVDFQTSNAKIDGNVSGVSVYFKNAFNSLKNAITGNIDVNQMMVDNGGSLVADTSFTAKDLVVGEKTKPSTLTLKGTGTEVFETEKLKVGMGSTLNVADQTLNVGDKEGAFWNGSTLAFDINSDATGGKIAGDVTLIGDVNLKTDVSKVGLGVNKYEFITGSVDTTNGNWNETLGTNNLYNVALNENNKQIDFTIKSSNEINLGSTNENKAIAAVISGGEAEGNTAFNNVANNISTLLQSSNPADVAKGLKMVDQMSVEAAPAATTVSTETANAVFGAVGSRLSGGSAAGKQGMASGDNYLENGAVWAQGMYNKSKLDKANGFDADTNGIAFGAEKNITDTTKAGIGYTYSTTDIDSDSRTTDVDTHTAIAYGEYKPSNWYVNGIATYSCGSYDENSSIKSAKYDVDSIGLQAMTGYEMLMNNNLMVTPEAGVRYVNIKQKSYTDSLGNKVDEKTDDVWTGVAGIKVSKDFALENGMILRPEARVALTYDLTQADSGSVVTLANGSSYAADADPLKRFGQEIGFGLTAEVNDNVELNVGYEGRFRTDYSDHTGLLNAKYKF